jgi:hypothetical protein
MEIRKPSSEENVEAILVALLCAAVNRYDAMEAAVTAGLKATGELPIAFPLETRRDWTTQGFNNVIGRLGPNSPYRNPLEQLRDEFLADLSSPLPTGLIGPKLSLVP